MWNLDGDPRAKVLNMYQDRVDDPYGFVASVTAWREGNLWEDLEALDQAAGEWQIRQLKRKIDQLTVARDTHQQGIERAQRQIKKIEENGL